MDPVVVNIPPERRAALAEVEGYLFPRVNGPGPNASWEAKVAWLNDTRQATVNETIRLWRKVFVMLDLEDAYMAENALWAVTADAIELVDGAFKHKRPSDDLDANNKPKYYKTLNELNFQYIGFGAALLDYARLMVDMMQEGVVVRGDRALFDALRDAYVDAVQAALGEVSAEYAKEHADMYESEIFPLITTIFACTFNKPLCSLGIQEHSSIVIWGPVLVQPEGEGGAWVDAYASCGGILIDVADVDRVRIMLNPRAVQVTPRRDIKCQFVDDEGKINPAELCPVVIQPASRAASGATFDAIRTLLSADTNPWYAGKSRLADPADRANEVDGVWTVSDGAGGRRPISGALYKDSLKTMPVVVARFCGDEPPQGDAMPTLGELAATYKVQHSVSAGRLAALVQAMTHEFGGDMPPANEDRDRLYAAMMERLVVTDDKLKAPLVVFTEAEVDGYEEVVARGVLGLSGCPQSHLFKEPRMLYGGPHLMDSADETRMELSQAEKNKLARLAVAADGDPDMHPTTKAAMVLAMYHVWRDGSFSLLDMGYDMVERGLARVLAVVVAPGVDFAVAFNEMIEAEIRAFTQTTAGVPSHVEMMQEMQGSLPEYGGAGGAGGGGPGGDE